MRNKKSSALLIILFIISAIIIPIILSNRVTASQEVYLSFDPFPYLNLMPTPENNAEDVQTPVTLGVEVSNHTNDTVDVYFYNALNDSLIGVDYGVETNWSTALTQWNNLQEGDTYSWYVVLDDGNYPLISQTWSFTTYRQPSPNPPSPPSNSPPTADAGEDYTGYENQTIIFDGRGSFDSDGVVTQYRWDFTNDGVYDTSWDENAVASHSYNLRGNYTVKLEVMDNDGATDEDTTQVTIHKPSTEGIPPTADANGPYVDFVNQNVVFNGSNSHDPDGSVVNYSWDFGNETTGFGEIATHAYDKVGTYVAMLTVKDSDGLSDSNITSVVIIAIQNDVIISNITHYLVDTTGNDQIDGFYNTTNQSITNVNLTKDGKYLIDDNADGEWDYIFDAVTEELILYEIEERKRATETFGITMAIIMFYLLILIAIIAIVIFKERNKH